MAGASLCLGARDAGTVGDRSPSAALFGGAAATPKALGGAVCVLELPMVPVTGTRRSAVVLSGALWAVVYNVLWAAAWFVFMRREWLAATAAIHDSTPWRTIWVVWVVTTLPLGVAMMAYVAGRAGSVEVRTAALAAGSAVWVVITLGMAVWGVQQALSIRVIALDSMVNLFAILVASLAGTASQRDRMRRGAQHRPTG